MAALICGSLAYDSIMVFEDHFKNHILPDKVHMLNVSFLVPELRKAYGGCAGNISYNLKLLGGEPLPMAAVGSDYEPYREHFDAMGIDQRYVLQLDDFYTAQCFITTDLDDNQITAFHPGAMMESHRNNTRDADGAAIAIVAPDGRDAMLQHAAALADAGIPFVYDPGQSLPLFDGDDLKAFIEKATWVTVNDYESELVKKRTGWNEAYIASQVEAYIVTKGGEGSLIYTSGDVIQVHAAQVSNLSDPTGCGDAYRAGLLYGLEKGLDWLTIGRIASVMGAIKIETYGTQNHKFDGESFRERFKGSYGEDFVLG